MFDIAVIFDEAIIVMTPSTSTPSEAPRIEELLAQIATLEAEKRQISAQRDAFRDAFERARIELLLIRRRIFLASAERVDTTQLELEFKEKLNALEVMAGTLGMPVPPDGNEPERTKRKPTGRRNLRDQGLEEQRLELTDPVFDALVAQGKAKLIKFDESSRLAWQRGGMRVLILARAVYQTVDGDGESVVATTEMPPEAFARCMAAPSLIAHIAVAKHCDGLPLARQEEILSRDGVPLDRGTMCRYLEDLGGTVGATVVEAMQLDAKRTAFCVATDATGVRIQPEREAGKRNPCDRGHFFIQIADRDHVLFTYTRYETSAAVAEMFKGYKGYVQADAKNVFDVLFLPDAKAAVDHERRSEVGCWSHARRRFWEAAVAKFEVGREGLRRIGRIFELDATWRGRPPNDIKRLRQLHLRLHVDAFFEWAADELKKVEAVRGLVRDALGYATRQREPLSAFLADGRLEMTNNRSERGLRNIAVGRKNWLFCGSDDHAEAAANIMTTIASAKLHRLDPELYLRDLIRVLPHWPKDRYLELAPKYWKATRALLDAQQLVNEYGPLDVPEPEDPATEQKTGSN